MLKGPQSAITLGLSLTNQGVNIMYRIQAHNIVTKDIEIYKVSSWEHMAFKQKLKQSGSYGLITSEWLARY